MTAKKQKKPITFEYLLREFMAGRMSSKQGDRCLRALVRNYMRKVYRWMDEQDYRPSFKDFEEEFGFKP